MSQQFKSPLDQLREIDPNTSPSEKERLLWECLLKWVSSSRNNNFSEEDRAIAKVVQETTSQSPNIFIYRIIVLGMSDGGWWKLTEKQRQVTRNYIFERNSFNKVADMYGVAYPSARETFLRGLESLLINAITNYPSLKDILTSQPLVGKSKATKQYRDEKRENLAKLRETEAYAKRQFIPGPGRGHRKESTDRTR